MEWLTGVLHRRLNIRDIMRGNDSSNYSGSNSIALSAPRSGVGFRKVIAHRVLCRDALIRTNTNLAASLNPCMPCSRETRGRLMTSLQATMSSSRRKTCSRWCVARTFAIYSRCDTDLNRIWAAKLVVSRLRRLFTNTAREKICMCWS